ncbi:ATP-binding protein [Microcoleus sp. FACHB-672]|uniref:ATP-binding protein n=1 Tax=Microcoleus sp. FACHB-672 TaxID=2692825 RepID=UPI00168A312E|nr:ATP-binding protein [Microcoleus sp. FACHB-672]
MIPGLIVGFSLLLNLPVMLAISWIQHTSVKWLGWAVVLASSLLFSVIETLALGVADGIGFAVTHNVLASLFFGVAHGMVRSLVFSLMSGVMLTVAFSTIFGLGFGAVNSVVCSFIFCLWFGTQSHGLISGLVLAMVGVGGALHLPFYAFQLCMAGSVLRKKAHPVEWDELIILPLLGTERMLIQCLQQAELDGLRLIDQVAQNPFQRWAAQRALQIYLHNHQEPIKFFYTLLSCSDLNDYIVTPLNALEPIEIKTKKQLLLALIAGKQGTPYLRFLSRGKILAQVELLIWWITTPLRDHRRTLLTRFADILYGLETTNYFILDLEKEIKGEKKRGEKHGLYYLFFQHLTSQSVQDLIIFPGGKEIIYSFQALATFLSYENLSELPNASNLLLELPPLESAIRPTVLAALNRLGKVGVEVATYQTASNRSNKLAALARATDELEAIYKYVVSQVVTLEQAPLVVIIHQWRRLVSEVGGKLGRAVVSGPVQNPYVAGNPVTGNLFVGREDILWRLKQSWTKPGQCDSVVLYGHRRMGKTSVLRNIGAYLEANTVLVIIDMRSEVVNTTSELLYDLAIELFGSLSPAQQEKLGEPDEQLFSTNNPFRAFKQFLKNLNFVRGEQRFILAIDEFEIIEEMIEDNQLEPRLLNFWRSMIQKYDWFIMAFIGLHTLDEMRRDYWNPFFGNLKSVPVSFLSDGAAQQLIKQPSPDFDIEYELEAVKQIIELTNRQPYLVQLIGDILVSHFNRRTFEEGQEQERRFTVQNIEDVIDSTEFYADGDAYFNGVWVQAKDSQPDGQLEILRQLCVKGMSLTELVQETGLTIQQVQAALETLQRHDVIKLDASHYVYTVELMRRWVKRQEGV